MQTKNQISLTRKTMYGIMLLGVFVSAFGTGWDHSELSNQERRTQLQVENTSSDDFILPQNLEYAPSLDKFDVSTFFQEQISPLQDFSILVDGKSSSVASVLQDVALKNSINPRVLLVLLEMKTGLITNPSIQKLNIAAGYPHEKYPDFATQVALLGENLANAYRESFMGEAKGIIADADGEVVPISADLQSASYAIMKTLAQTSRLSQTNQDVSSLTLQFTSIYSSWFGNPFTVPIFVQNASLPSDALLPFAGAKHYTGGPHIGGICSQQDISSASGLDFAGSTFQVLSIADGQYLGKGETTGAGLQAGKYVLIQYSTGIQSMYWHLSEFSPEINALIPGQFIVRGFPIGWTGNSGNQSAVHLHMELRMGATFDNPYSGTRVSWDGQTIEGWTVWMFRWPGKADKGISYVGSAVKGITRTQSITNVKCGQTIADAIVSTGYPVTTNATNGLDSNTVFANYPDVVLLTSVNRSSTISLDKPPAVILYEDANYQGHSLMLTQSDPDLCDNPLASSQPPVNPCFSAPSWNDVASSIKVMPGYQIWLYLHSKSQEQELGEYYIYRSCNTEIPDFSDPIWNFPNGVSLNNNVSRVIIEKCGSGSSANPAFPANGISIASINPCDPDPYPSPTDNASFISDITLPDGTIVSPGQSLTKTWRVKNIGTSTWGAGYKLVFVDGEQMGAPIATNVPSTAPNATLDLSIPLTAPSASGNHSGYFQLRNPQGTYFGPKFSVKIKVSSQSSKITIFTADPASPANATTVRFHARTDGVNNFRAMRILVDGEVKYELGAPDYFYDWDTAGYNSGDHNIIVEVADQTDTSWSHPYRKNMTYTLQGTAIPVNHKPNPPLITSPYNWYVYYSGSTASLCAQAQGDPDGDSISSYNFVIHDSGQNWDSGWVASNCTTTSSLPAYNYQWHVRVQDSRGAISGWSQDSHFTIVNQNLSITSFDLIPLDGNSENVRLKACVTGQGGVGITTRFLVNSATNGTDSGYWTNVGELGVPCFSDINAPIWHTLEDNALSGDGQHLVRVEAHGASTGWNGAVSQDKVINLPHRRPSDLRLKAPIPASLNNREAIYLNSRSIPFSWYLSDRASSYRLSVSVNPSPKDDANPVFRQTYAAGITQASVNFSQDYPTLYWQIEAINDAGINNSTDQLFGIDRIAPTCSIQPLSSVSYENNFQVHWNGSDSLSGVGSYNIQYNDSRSGEWSDWLTSLPATKTYDLFIGQPGHTYSFRCQAMDNAGNPGQYPSNGDTSITIDPSSRPQEAWWNLGYTNKRNITVQNNMPDVALPASYPINVQFTSGTTPSATEIYNLSQSSNKCDDLRIVYNNTTEINRFIKKCGPDAIDIWFRTQAGIPAGGTNASYQVYISNPSASNPPADANQVWYPYKESDTTNLYRFQEGSGSTTADSSGNNKNCSIGPSVQWGVGKFGNYIQVSQQSTGGIRALLCSTAPILNAFTVEFWINTSADYDGRLVGALGGGGNGGPGNNWMIGYVGRIHLEVNANGGSQGADSNFNLRNAPYRGRWNHVAVAFNGGNQVSFYINGNLDSIKTLGSSGINTYSLPLEIGAVESGGHITAALGGLRISNSVKNSFPYGAFAQITNEPSTATGSAITPPVTGTPDLAILNMSAYSNSDGSLSIQADVINQGTLDTQNGFYTDLYLNHLPTGSGDYTGSLRFWVNDPIPSGGTASLTTVITDLSSLGAISKTTTAGSPVETSATLYAQTDSMGIVDETDKQNNIYSAGLPVCFAASDQFETDDTYAAASTIVSGAAQIHNFNRLGDQDWIKFNAEVGQKYIIATSGLGESNDTYLYLYGTDGVTLIASNDDNNGTLASQIEWQPATAGTYYFLVNHWNPSVGGCGTQYTISVTAAIIGTTLAVNKDGTGSGTVTSSPVGINCGSTCSYDFAYNTVVTLTAMPTPPSTFGGWSGGGCSGVGTCTVTMSSAQIVTATFNPPGNQTLTVSKSGTGSGTVTSSPSGINCGSTCSYAFAYNTVVTLTATPTSPSIFGGWSGAGCSGTGTCIVTMGSAQSVTATFSLPGPSDQTLTVSKSGTGSGTVTSSPAGINCGSTCSYGFAYNTVVVLTATPTSPFIFGGWSGAGCSGIGTCTVTMSSAQSVTATFTAPGNQILTVTKAGTGIGTVTSSPAGINCGATCSYAFAYNTVVTMTATPISPSTFGGWSGAGCSGTGTCIVTMSSAQSVTATFNDNALPIFSDVPFSYWASTFIEQLYNAGITGGCSLVPLMYCPEVEVNRAQMAVFLLRGEHGSAYVPPDIGTGTGFTDVPADYWSAAWIKQLAIEGITSGCGPSLYCPETSVTRDQMAVFLLRAEHGASYTPPPATGVFTDVPTDHWAAPWIEQLAAEGITGGCGVDTYCPSTPVTRAQMAVFLVRTFNLP